LELALRLAFVLVSVIVTFALGTAAPEEPVTVPTKEAPTACENATPAHPAPFSRFVCPRPAAMQDLSLKMFNAQGRNPT
jgi:hypothetical protein